MRLRGFLDLCWRHVSTSIFVTLSLSAKAQSRNRVVLYGLGALPKLRWRAAVFVDTMFDVALPVSGQSQVSSWSI